MQVGPYGPQRRGARPSVQCAITVGVGAVRSTHPMLKLTMSFQEHRRWIFDLMEELDVGDDHENDLDFSSDSEDKCVNQLAEI